MAQKPISMERLKQILQLSNDCISIREIAKRTGMSRNSVRKYLTRLATKGPVLSDSAIADLAYANDALEMDERQRKQLVEHFKSSGTELSKTGVTRRLLWQEYRDANPDGYSYSRYCYHLKQYYKNQDYSMHLEYNSGDMLMIDFAGKKQYYTDLDTGELISCDVFVAILPFSGQIFCIAVHTQQTADFVQCINSALKFYGGVPATIVCDNLKTAVIKPDRYEPTFTEICEQLSIHYTTTFTATRPYSPKDKALVESAVSIVYNNIYAPLRNQQYYSIDALNEAMAGQLQILNNKPYKSTPYSRNWYFTQQECNVLKPLPSNGFTAKTVKWLTVQRNYHIQLTESRHYYSVPYQYVGKKVKVMYDAEVVEVYLQSNRVAVHQRKRQVSAYTTLEAHMPPNHKKMREIKGFNKDDLLAMAARIGPKTLAAATLMLNNSIFMEQNYKACFGMQLLEKKYSKLRLEAACSRALLGTRVNYTMIKNILIRGLDKQLEIDFAPCYIPEHGNIRGKEHYK